MNTRSYSSGAYRYGFNGQEKDDEIGDCYAFKYRIHDARLGRFLSIDPINSSFPWNSTFAFAENRVVQCMDFEGLEAWEATTKWATNSALLFGKYVSNQNNVNLKIKRTCEDLAIGLIVDFAKTQGYPLNLKLLNGVQYNAQDKQFKNLTQYKNVTMKNSTAESLRKSGIFKSCGNTKDANVRLGIQNGDVLFSMKKNKDNQIVAGHVQVVTERGKVTQEMLDKWNNDPVGNKNLLDNFKLGDEYARTIQGNFDGETSWIKTGEEDPTDDDYVGAHPAYIMHNLTQDLIVREYGEKKMTPNYSTEGEGVEVDRINKGEEVKK